MESGLEGSFPAGAGDGSGATASGSVVYHLCRWEREEETGWGAMVSVKAGSVSFSGSVRVPEGCAGVGVGVVLGATASS